MKTGFISRDHGFRRCLVACALTLGAVLVAYANHFHNAFHFDDAHTIQNNLYIRDLSNIPRFFTTPRTFSSLPPNQMYRPLVTTTLALDYWRGGGLNPVAFHVTSFTLFLIQCVAMLILYIGVMDRARPDSRNRWVALAAMALYALHPANAETVNYIIARSEILATLGVVVAVVMFAAGGPWRRYGLYLIPALAGVLAKEHGAMAAPLLWCYVLLIERGRALRDLLRPSEIVAGLRATGPAFLVCGATVAMGLRLATTFQAGGTSRWQYLLAQPFVVLHYALTFLLPMNLTADTDWKPIANPFDDRVIVGAAFIVLLLWAAARASERQDTRPIAFGILWFFVALLPTSSVVPLAEVTNDHRMYFPFVGLTLAGVWGVWLVADRATSGSVSPTRPRTVMLACTLAVLAAMGYGTWRRNIVWRTEESLWRDVTDKSPENGRGLMTYGVILMGKGNYAEADRYFSRALQYTPQYAYLHVNIGVLKGALGDGVEAERHFREAQQYAPGNPVSYVFYARWLGSVGRVDEAVAQARHAVDLSPGDVDARTTLTDLETRQATLERTPAPAAETAEQWLTLSLAQYRDRKFEACIESSRQALRLRPDYAEAFNNICAANNELGRYREAAVACEQALAIKPDFPLARNNLAAARRSEGVPSGPRR